MSFLYNLAYLTFGFFYLPVFLGKIRQAENPRRLLAERMGYVPALPAGQKTVWLHAVSVGEVMAVRKFVEEFQGLFPDYHLVLTTVTPTGQSIARSMQGPNVSVFYFPFDLSFVCRRFFSRLRPVCLLLAETEIWPNLLSEAARAGVPAGILNARLSERSARRYKRASFIFRKFFSGLDFVLAQSEEDAERFRDVGVAPERVQVAGNMKYDNAALEEKPSDNGYLKTRCNLQPEDKVLIAGSTHPGEDEILGRVLLSLRADFPRLRMIIAPRHIERTPSILKLIQAQGLSVDTASKRENQNWDVLVLDHIGVLKDLYRIADFVFMGGSLVPHGGQNPIEPAGFKKAVIHGTHVFNFQKVYQMMDKEGACLCARGEAELSAAVRTLLTDPGKCRDLGERAFTVVKRLQGATRRHLEYVGSFLSRSHERIQDVQFHEKLFPAAGGRL